MTDKLDNITTRQHLKAISDRGQFEKLASAILRRADQRYAGLIETGTNAEGEPIADLVDGIYRCNSSALPEYISFSHTTAERPKLRGKWLTNSDADLPKCFSVLETLRQSAPKAKFTIVLTTNTNPSSRLCTDIYGIAAEKSIEIDIWDQSRLSDFLDHDPEGQWLRNKLLGVKEERLSASLLRDLCQKSLSLYRREVLVDRTNPIVERNASRLRLCNRPFQLLVGQSGSGKSVALIQEIERHLDGGGFAMWIPPKTLLGRNSVPAALSDWLMELYPSLGSKAGLDALAIATDPEGVLIVVDDVNRTPDPLLTIRHMKSLFDASPSDTKTSQKTGSGEGVLHHAPSSTSLVRAVIPVWPQFELTSNQRASQSEPLGVIKLSSMTDTEAISIVQKSNSSMSTSDARRHVASLDKDPFLLGLLPTLCQEQPAGNEHSLFAPAIIDRFVDVECRRISLSNPTASLPVDIQKATDALAREMVVRRNLQPSWVEVEAWLGSNSHNLVCIRLLCQDSSLCRILDSHEGGDLIFRHDRLRDYLLARAMRQLIISTEAPFDVIYDPYFATVTGLALLQLESIGNWGRRFAEHSPLALFRAIQLMGEPQSDCHLELVDHALWWIREKRKFTTDSELDAICFTILETDSPAVLQMTDVGLSNWVVEIAGLRNGSLKSGMKSVATICREELAPSIHYPQLETAIDVALDRHSDSLCEQMHRAVPNPNCSCDDAIVFLTMLGYFGYDGFDAEIHAVWREVEKTPLAIAAGIWCVCRCPLTDTMDLLGPMLDQLSMIPTRESPNSLGPREDILLQIRGAFRAPITEASIQCLLEYARCNPDIAPDIAGMFEGVNHPDALEFRLRQTEGWWVFDRYSRAALLNDSDAVKLDISELTLSRMEQIWRNEGESSKLRSGSFGIWLATQPPDGVEVARSIQPSSCLCQLARQYRVKMGDHTVIHEMDDVLEARSSWSWWKLIHPIWGAEVETKVIEKIKKLSAANSSEFYGNVTDEHYGIANLLLKIPPIDAERILSDHWGSLRYSPPFITAALRVGTHKCMTLAESSLQDCPEDVDIFTHSFLDWGHESIHPSNPLSEHHLNALLPHLNRMNERQLERICSLVDPRRYGSAKLARWVQKHVRPHSQSDTVRRVAPTDEELLVELEIWAQREILRVDIWLEDFERRGDSNDRVFTILDNWCDRFHDLCGFRVVTACYKLIATRKQIGKLRDRFLDTWSDDFERFFCDMEFSVKLRTLND